MGLSHKGSGILLWSDSLWLQEAVMEKPIILEKEEEGLRIGVQ